VHPVASCLGSGLALPASPTRGTVMSADRMRAWFVLLAGICAATFIASELVFWFYIAGAAL